MGRGKDIIAVGLMGAVLAEAAPVVVEHAEQLKSEKLHTPASYFGTMAQVSTATTGSSGTITSMFDTDCSHFVAIRIYYPQPVEVLTDLVSEQLPVAPTTYVV